MKIRILATQQKRLVCLGLDTKLYTEYITETIFQIEALGTV